MDIETRRVKLDQMISEVIGHIRDDAAIMDSDLRLLRRTYNPKVMDLRVANIAKQASIAIASLTTLLREIDQQGLAHSSVQTFEEALRNSPDATPGMLEDWLGDPSNPERA